MENLKQNQAYYDCCKFLRKIALSTKESEPQNKFVQMYEVLTKENAVEIHESAKQIHERHENIKLYTRFLV